MARKQSDYLASLLADESAGGSGNSASASALPLPAGTERTAGDRAAGDRAGEPGAERGAGRAGLSLLGRENALARMASGEVRQVTQLLLNPDRVRVWAGNARVQAQLTEDNCRDLIDSIVAEGGQKVPAVVRHLTGDPDHDYELIAGTRRHFAIAWLRSHSWPEMKLLAQVADLDDEAAFRLADVENRARRDISDIERARNYAEALDRHYAGKAVRMAERLKVSKGWLSKMLKAATLPDEVLSAFANWPELTLNPAYKLACAMDDPVRAEAIRHEAARIAAENRALVGEEAPPLPGTVALARLLQATATPAERDKDFRCEVSGPFGRPMLLVKAVNRQGITLHLPMASGAGDEQLAEALKDVLQMLRTNGVSVS